MIPQEHRISAALGHLGPLVVPDLRQPRWWQRTARTRDRAIRAALAAAGLPELDDIGRTIFVDFYALQAMREAERKVGLAECWAIDWCRALGLRYRVSWEPGYIFDPRTLEISTVEEMTAHERIQLLHEEARHGA